jgi:hypothetical protein
MPRNTEYRQKLVEEAHIRGFSVREIEAALAKKGLTNPRTNKPWSYVTVYNDIKKIRIKWREELNKTREDRIAELLPELQALKKEGWLKTDYELVRRVIKDLRDLMGLDMPKRTELGLTPELLNVILGGFPPEFAEAVRGELAKLVESEGN